MAIKITVYRPERKDNIVFWTKIEPTTVDSKKEAEFILEKKENVNRWVLLANVKKAS